MKDHMCGVRHNVTFLAIALALTLTACNSFKPEQSDLDRAQMFKQKQFRKNVALNVKYLLFLPADYTASSQKGWPLILFLHGSGERGNDLRKVAIHGPSKYVAEHPDFPFIVVSPQCAQGEHWSTGTLLALLNEVTRQYKVDEQRIYLTGFSMGGYGTWDLGLEYPEKFAAIAPICGGGEMITLILASREKPQALKSLAVWAFHGDKDPVVSIEESQRMIDALKKIGVKQAKLTSYPEAGHNSWTRTYDNPELYRWLLQHERELVVK
jgi:predicted peptidase